MRAVLVAVAAAPPRYAGGGYWEAIRDDTTGRFEVRANGPKRHRSRRYCRLGYEAKNAAADKPLLVAIAGLDKPFQTDLSSADYAGVLRPL